MVSAAPRKIPAAASLEREKGAADLRIERRRQMERSEEFSVDDRLAAETIRP
jgi:hypothetical protein